MQCLIILANFLDGQILWLLSIIADAWEVEVGRSQVPGQPGQLSKALSQNKESFKRVGVV